MKAPVNSRYAHCDGITDISLFDDGGDGKLLTCGSDGDIRMWKNPEDTDPFVFSASDGCMAISCYKKSVYVGTENNSVEAFSLPSGKAAGVIAKFTAAVNHLDVSKSGTILAAGSGDMTIQILKLDNDSLPPTKISGHSAPILSVLIDPKEEFLLSSSCDGSVCIWTLLGKQVKSWDNVFPSSNDILTSKTLCRPAWSHLGESIAIPQKQEICIYSRDTWTETKMLKGPSGSGKLLSVVLFSPDGKYLGAGQTDGTLLVWNVESGKLLYENVDTKDHICGLLFGKNGRDLFAVDTNGRMIFVKDFVTPMDTQDEEFDMDEELGDVASDKKIAKGVVAEDDDVDPFDDDMDGMLLDDDPEANEFSISKIKAMSGFIASENDNKEDVFVGVDRAAKIAGLKKNVIVDDDDDASRSSLDSRSRSAAGMVEDMDKKPQQIHYRPQPPIVIPFTEPQKPFQPASSPEHLQHRFMVWNSVGIIRNYSLEDDDSDGIDIEFHDVSFHNGIHLRNQYDYNIAALGKEAVVFSSKKDKKDDTHSKLMCLHFSCWENNKEWSLDLPWEEEVTGLAIGSGWLAASTDLNRIRIFSIGGVQRNLLDIGGQIIALSAHEDLLFLAFHNGIGLHGTQSISYSILKIRSGTGIFPLVNSEPLPLSPKSEVTWIGFSDEGTPAFSDDTESVRILSGRMWTTFLSMKQGMKKSESDHYWVTGLSLCSQNVRVIKCKGTRYPVCLPRPTILLLEAKLPLCEMESEKSQLEDSFLRSTILNSLSKKMDKKGYDVEDFKDQADKEIKETLMKLFALCCKSDKDYRASEYVQMMPSTHSVQIAIKYANKLRKMALTDRLTNIGRKKLDEEDEGVEEDDDDFENMRSGNVIYSSVYSNMGNHTSDGGAAHDIFSNLNGSGRRNSTNQPSSSDIIILEENPLLSRQREEIHSILSSSVYKNPFKRDSNSNSKTNGSEATSSKSDTPDVNGGKGLALIDAWKKPIDKPLVEFNPKNPTRKGNSKKDKEKGDKADKPARGGGGARGSNKKQTTLFAMKIKRTDVDVIADESSNSEPILLNSDSNSNSNSEPADTTDKPKTVEKKRKRSEGDEEEVDTEKKSRITSKLSAFALIRE